MKTIPFKSTIYSIQEQVVLESNQNEIDLSQLNPGLYLIKVKGS